ncbi:hypothetical protein [Oceanobacillus saliphilus]|uniref:hypothetical protein n=1 Tax=Oceanobacillus saliphilus TaxID=2925834 RepID=UPI00201DE1C0|nr:hypothetical protein [Oceanobacillus saliphilus]
MKTLRKLSAVILAGIFVLSTSTGVLAKGAVEKEKSVDVSMMVTSEQEFEVIYTGEEIELQAITPKHGSSFKNEWKVFSDDNEVDLDVEFVTEFADVDGVNSYVSTAVFAAEEAGTYILTYSIEMTAGKSHVRFAGEAQSEEIVVVEPEEVHITGVVVENYSVIEQGSNFRAAGDIYFTMSEGGNQLAQSFSNIILNKGNSYTNTVEIEADDQAYTITVTKTGWTLTN